MDTNAYLSMFIDESNEHLQAINECLLELENDPEQLELVQQIFRSAHTLKGMSATMGFEDLADLTHKMENVLDLVRNEKLKMNKRIFDVLFQSLDAMEMMVADITEGGSGKADVNEIVRELEAIASGDAETDQAGAGSDQALQIDLYQQTIVKQAMEQNKNVYLLDVSLDEQCVMKAVRAFMVLEALNPLGEVFAVQPSVEEMERDFAGTSFQIGLITEQSKEKIQQVVQQVSEVTGAAVADWPEESASSSESKETEERKKDRQDGQQSSDESAQKGKQARSPGRAQLSRSIRVDIERLDHVMNLFSELLIDRVRLESLAGQINHPELTEAVEHMSRISSELQELVLNLRMMPLETVFNRFPRMVRDLASQLNKKIDFIVTGKETELDRTVIEEIGDPLVHLLRNSLDHGIETTSERLEAEKPETGTIHLRAYHSGNHVMIEIEDDGRGIDRDKVLATAIKRGIVTEDQAGELTDEQVYMLLFASGFSTADKVSDISGRGVGLDVVKSKINSLGGEVAVYSQRGKGTKFVIQLPLSLSIISAMLFKLGEETYAFPLSAVMETAIYEKQQVHHVHGNSMLEFRGQLIPLISLKDVLEVPEVKADDENELSVIIVRKGDRLAAVQVSEIAGQQEVVLKSLGSYLQNVFAVSGATILGDGQVALILDSNALIA